MAGTSVVWDIIARDRASKAFLGAAESAKAMQAAVTKSFNEQNAVASRSAARIKASLKAQEDEYLKAAAAAQRYGKGTTFLNSHKEHLDKVATGLAGVGAAAAIGFGAAVKQSMDFNDAMARVGAFSDDAREHMDQLRQLAMKVGVSIGYSATQSAGAMEEMVKAGVSTTDMINGGLKGALQLAAAGQIDVSEATTIAASAMTQFGLAGSKIPHVADLLAAGADKALGGVSDLGQALSYSGLQAHQYGVSVEDTIGVLSSFAQAGNLGSTAGEQLAQMLSRLGAPTDRAAKEMKAIGLNVYDTNGNFVNMTTLAGRLQKAFGNLSPATRNAAEQVIFGQRAMRGANIMIQNGSKGIEEWIHKVNDQGFAAQTASRKMDSLKGDLQKLRAEFDNLLISSGNSSQGPIRAAVQQLTHWIDEWNNLSDGAKTAIADIVGGIAVLGLGGAATIKVLTGIAGMKKALIDLGLTGKAAGAEMAVGAETGAAGMERSAGRLQKAAGGAAAAFIGVQVAGMVADKIIGDYSVTTESATGSLLKLAGSSKDAGKALGDIFVTPRASGDWYWWGAKNIDNLNDALNRTFNRSNWTKVNDWVTGVGSSMGLAKGQLGQLKDQFGEVDTALTNLASGGQAGQAAAAFQKIAVAAAKDHVSMQDLLTLFPQYKAQLQQQANDLGVTSLSAKDYAAWMGGKIPAAIKRAEAASKGSKTATDDVTRSTNSASDALQKERAELEKAREAYIKIAQATIGAYNDTTAYHQAIADATKAIKENGHSLSLNTQAGRDNRTALSNLASATVAHIKDLIDQGKKQSAVTEATKQGREQFINIAMQMGKTRAQAKKLADQVGLNVKAMKAIPKKVSTQITTPGMAAAQHELEVLKSKVADLNDKTVRVHYKVDANGNVLKLANNGSSVQYASGGPKAVARAGGGSIFGAGTETSDSIHVMASNNEHMWSADEVRGAGGHRAVEGLRKLAKARLLHRADGGPILRRVTMDTQFPNAGGLGALLAGAQGAINAMAQPGLKKAAEAAIASIPAMSGGGGVARWAPLILKALSMLGQPASLLGAVERRMNQESGGNPHAINRWDANAKAGHPSQGLMQTIPGTFAAYAGPFRSRGILDPMASIYAGLNYAIHAYPSLAYAMNKSGGYRNGTDSAIPGVHIVGEDGPEAILFGGGEKVIPHLASGGPVKASEFGSSRSFSVAQIVSLLRAIESPAGDLGRLTGSLRAAQAANRAAQRAIAHPTHVLDQADAAYNHAVRQRNNLRAQNAQQIKDARDLVAIRQRSVDLAKKELDQAKGKAARAQAQHILDAKQSQLDAARNHESKVSRDNTLQLAQASKRVADTEVEKKRATDAYNKVAATAKARADALRTAQENLAQENQAVADSTKQMSDSITGFYTPQTSSPTSLLQSMTEGASDIKRFTADIDRLRKAHLSESVIGQVIAEAQSDGVPSGAAFAESIIAGGSTLIKQLNAAAQQLTDAGQIFGYRQAVSTGGYASGTNWATPGIHDVAENSAEIVIGRQLRRFNGGEQVLNGQQTKQLLTRSTPPINIDVHGNDVKDPDLLARRVAVKVSDALTMHGLSMGVG